MVHIENFNLNEDMLVVCDYDGLDDLEMGPFEHIKPMFGLMTTPSAPSNFENIATLNILDMEAKVAKELLKIYLTLSWKS
jgi:hypothetical protein